jgi:hypothetical protein
MKVYDDQVIPQAIKALRARSLYSHFVREWLKTVAELYEDFTKFSKLEVLHFRKLKQHRKAPKHGEASRPTYYHDNQHSYPKQVHIIDSEDLWSQIKLVQQERGGRLAPIAIAAEDHSHSTLCIACTMATIAIAT